MDNLIQGRILLAGGNAGIADLPVVLYDLDPRQDNEFATSITHDDPIEELYSNPALRTWIDFPGDRIGSVLTDPRGRFELRYDDAAFRVRNDEKRPDLVLLVLGPDRAPASAVLARLLHYALIPRANAGRIESYLISIDAALLRNRGVHLPEQGAHPERLDEERAHQLEQRERVSGSYRRLGRDHRAARAPLPGRIDL